MSLKSTVALQFPIEMPSVATTSDRLSVFLPPASMTMQEHIEIIDRILDEPLTVDLHESTMLLNALDLPVSEVQGFDLPEPN